MIPPFLGSLIFLSRPLFTSLPTPVVNLCAKDVNDVDEAPAAMRLHSATEANGKTKKSSPNSIGNSIVWGAPKTKHPHMSTRMRARVHAGCDKRTSLS